MLSLLWAGLGLQAGRGDDGPPADAPGAETLRFRRVLAPADRLKDWPRDNVKYVPIDAAEFARLLAISTGTAPEPPAALVVQVATAEYEARLVGSQMMSGQATLHVVHTAKAASLLPLDPCGLAIGKAVWAGTPPAKAELGLGVDGRLAALVERSGQLQCEWSLEGRHDAPETTTFQFDLPDCAVSRFRLDLPDNVTPQSDHGLIQEAGWVDEGTRRWRIELGGHHRFRLRLLPAGASQQRPQLALVRESLTYDFTVRGVDVSAQLRFEVHDEPLDHVTVVLDPGLRLVTARCGDVSVPWSVQSAGDNQETRVVLSLPEPIQQSGRVLRLWAMAPLQTDRAWRLPRIRPEQVFWQEGNGTLSVQAPLVLKQVVPIGGRQSATGPLPAPRVGESAQFQYFAPDATVEVVLARRTAVIQVVSGTAVTLSPGEATARTAADFRAAEAAQFTLEADVAAQWLIDSVETVPADAMDDWTLDKVDGGKRKMTVRLAKAIAPEQPLRVLIVARRLRSPVGQKLAIDDLVPVRLRTAAAVKRLVAVRTADPFQLQLSGAEQLKRVDVKSLSAAELDLFSDPPRSLLFENDAGAAALRILMERRRPSYTCTIRVEADFDRGVLREGCLVRCVPESAGVGRVLVHFSLARGAPLRWSLVGDDAVPVSARRLSTEEQVDAGLDGEQETWELAMPRPQSRPFEISGVREVKSAGSQAISLVSLPEAASQRATLVVRSSSGTPLRIKNDRLRPIPSETVAPQQPQTIRATFSYDPVRDTVASPEAAVTVSALGEAITPPVWAWHCHLQSSYEADGKGRHRVTYRLQSSGGGSMELRLPDGVAAQDVRDVRVDDQRTVARRVEGREGSVLAVDLPPDEKFPTVALCFTTEAGRLGVVGRLDPPMPRANLTVLSQHWTVRLPPGYCSVDSGLSWQPLGSPQLGWSRRLFGPLGRGADGPAFDPLAPQNWLHADADHAVRLAAAGGAERLLQLLGSARAADAAAPAPTWGGLLADKAFDAIQVKLLVDRRALAELGLTPQTRLRAGSGDTAVLRGVDLLQKADLALLVHADACLLTSQTDAALLHAWLAPLECAGLRWVLPGPVSEQLQQAAAMSDPALVSGEVWQKTPAEPKLLWSHAGPPGRPLGWTAYRTELSDALPCRLSFVHSQSVQLLGSVVFLLAVALGWWTARRRPLLLGVLSGASAVAALLLWEAFVPIAAGALLGTLFCLVMGLVRRPTGAVSSHPQTQAAGGLPSTLTAVTQFPVVVLAIAAATLLCRTAQAEGPPANAAPQSPVYRVLIPIDDRQQPTGGKYYVPEEFYKQLYRRAAAGGEKPQGWLIGGATYRGALSREAGAEGFVVDVLKASFDLHVLSQPARVRIPLRREGANLLPDGALLDDRVVQADWEPEGDALVFEVAEPGRHRVELSLRPTMRNGGASGGFEVAIPRLANSRLELLLPAIAPTIEVPSALGAVWREDEPRQLVAELGPSDRLSVRWPGGAGPSGNTPAVDVEELLWLKVQPGSVLIDAKFKLRVLEGQVRQLQLTADPRLRLLPVQGDDAPAVEVRTVPGQPQTIVLHWPRPVADRASIDATFLLTGASAVGNLRPPQLEVLDARTTRCWMAVSVDPALEHEARGSDQFESVALADFAAAWGKADAQPRFAFRLVPDETAWSMSIRPREPHTTVEQTLALSFAEDTTQVFFDAQLATTAGFNFQLGLRGPADLAVDRISVVEEGAERAARWSQDPSGLITVFLTGPVAGRQALSLRGRIPTPLRKKVPLPLVQIDRGSVLSSTVHVFRRPSAQVAVSRAAGLVEIEPPPLDQNKRDLGRLVGAFRVENGPPMKSTVTVTPNRPDMRAEQVTWLYRSGDAWQAEVACAVHASGGVVDELRLSVPRAFAGPYRVSPAAGLKTVDVPAVGRQLVVQPSAAIRGDCLLSIAGPWVAAPGEPVAAPMVTLQKIEQVKRYLVLPKESLGQPVIWETQGMKPSELPEGFATPAEAGASVAYQITEDACQAVLRTQEQTLGAARVRLADIRIAWQHDKTYRGVATFDLEPGKLAECPLWLPEGCRPLQVSVAEVPAAPVPVGQGTWRVTLGPARLPQRIEVVFAGTLPESPSGAARRFDAPALGQLPVMQTLWTVVGPAGLQADELDQAEPLIAWQYELARLKNIAAMMQSAAATGSHDGQAALRWYRPWARRWLSALRAAERQLLPIGRTREGRSARSEVAALEREQRDLAERLGATKVASQLSAEPEVADEPDELWQRSLDRSQSAARYAFPEGVASMTLAYHRVPGSDLRNRLLAALGLALLTPLVIFGLRRRGSQWWCKKWPHALGVAAGLAWWLWLWPSVLGWVIVLASLVAAWRPGWKHSPPPPSSVISLRSLSR